MQGHTHISHGALLEVLGVWRALLGCKAFKLSSCIILCALKLDINGSFGKTDIIWHRCWKSLYLRTPEHSAELRQLSSLSCNQSWAYPQEACVTGIAVSIVNKLRFLVAGLPALGNF